MQETEGIDLDRDTVLAGVSAILQDEAKGRYYVVEVGSANAPCCSDLTHPLAFCLPS